MLVSTLLGLKLLAFEFVSQVLFPLVSTLRESDVLHHEVFVTDGKLFGVSLEHSILDDLEFSLSLQFPLLKRKPTIAISC